MKTQVYPVYRRFVLVSLVVIITAAAMNMIAPTPLFERLARDLSASLGAAVAMTMMLVILTTSIVAFLSMFVIDRLGFDTVWMRIAHAYSGPGLQPPAHSGTPAESRSADAENGSAEGTSDAASAT